VSDPAVDALIPVISNWGRWGDDDELGTLNFITPEKRVAASLRGAKTPIRLLTCGNQRLRTLQGGDKRRAAEGVACLGTAESRPARCRAVSPRDPAPPSGCDASSDDADDRTHLELLLANPARGAGAASDVLGFTPRSRDLFGFFTRYLRAASIS
jgi:hypothetical protein